MLQIIKNFIKEIFIIKYNFELIKYHERNYLINKNIFELFKYNFELIKYHERNYLINKNIFELFKYNF
jgi:hypothetical protein